MYVVGTELSYLFMLFAPSTDPLPPLGAMHIPHPHREVAGMHCAMENPLPLSPSADGQEKEVLCQPMLIPFRSAKHRAGNAPCAMVPIWLSGAWETHIWDFNR